MKPYSEQDGITIYHADCRETMASLAECSISSIVTDPPYELGFMGKSWDRSGIAYNVEVWKQCLRVLKPGGHLLAFGGSRTYHRLACAVEDAGFEIRDQIQWIYGSGFPKSLDVSKAIDAAVGAQREVVGEHPYANRRLLGERGQTFTTGKSTIGRAENLTLTIPSSDEAKQWDGWGTALKPAHEPIVLARKPLIGTVAENVLIHSTGGLNIDGCRVEHQIINGGNLADNPQLRGTKLRSAPVATAFGKEGDETPLTSQNGRWPANVIHDGSDEVLSYFPETQTGDGCVKRESGSDREGHQGHAYGKESRPAGTVSVSYGDFGNAARYFYCAKASQEDRDEGLKDLARRSAGEVTDRKDGSDGLNSPRAGAGRTSGSRNHHPTVKPTDLMRYLVRMVTPIGGIVLDPFAGSGSTGKACAHEGFQTILIEKEIEYCELAMRRSRLAQPRLMFA